MESNDRGKAGRTRAGAEEYLLINTILRNFDETVWARFNRFSFPSQKAEVTALM